MAVIKAFKALRPIPEKAADVASLPYDVFTEEEARMAVVNKPESFLRVVRPETTMAENTDLTAPAVYRRAKENLDALIEQGILSKKKNLVFISMN